jgi:flagellar hook-associated protein 2
VPPPIAVFKINGLQLSSPKNSLSGVVDGLNLTLSKVTTNAVQVTVGDDTASMKKSITDFVSAFNDIGKYLSAQTRYDEATKVAGALQGDRSAVGLQNQLRGLLQQTSPASTVFQRLGDLGLELQRDGTIKLDTAKLDAAMADPEEVSKAFSTLQTGFGQRFKAFADSVLGTDGLVTTRTNGLRDSIARNDKDQQRVEGPRRAGAGAPAEAVLGTGCQPEPVERPGQLRAAADHQLEQDQPQRQLSRGFATPKACARRRLFFRA